MRLTLINAGFDSMRVRTFFLEARYVCFFELGFIPQLRNKLL